MGRKRNGMNKGTGKVTIEVRWRGGGEGNDGGEEVKGMTEGRG